MADGTGSGKRDDSLYDLQSYQEPGGYTDSNAVSAGASGVESGASGRNGR